MGVKTNDRDYYTPLGQGMVSQADIDERERQEATERAIKERVLPLYVEFLGETSTKIRNDGDVTEVVFQRPLNKNQFDILKKLSDEVANNPPSKRQLEIFKREKFSKPDPSKEDLEKVCSFLERRNTDLEKEVSELREKLK